jgi:CspA family cold shock protein
MIVAGRVSWFKLDKKFGFVELPDGKGNAFLSADVLRRAGYVSVPAGTTMRVEVEELGGKPRVVDVFGIDTATALPGAPAAIRHGLSL